MFVEGFGQLTELVISHALKSGPQLHLAADPHSPRVARAFVREHVPDVVDLRDNAELLASELVTNGVLHARSSMTLGVVSREHAVLLAVTDASPVVPDVRHPRLPSLAAENGRGISLVATLARSWGVTRQPDGKIVWCLIDLMEKADDGVT